MSAAHVDDLVSRARFAQRLKKDREGAVALATEAHDLLGRMDGTLAERADVHAALAALWRDLGDAERCEPLIVEAIELEAQVAPARPVILGTHKLFYAMFLRDRQRLAEAAQQATDGLAIYERSDAPNPRELAHIRALVEELARAAREHPPT